jgi:hypothetical protein
VLVDDRILERFEGSGFTVQGFLFRVQGARFTVQGSRFTVHGSRFRVQGSGFTVQGSRIREWPTTKKKEPLLIVSSVSTSILPMNEGFPMVAAQ